MGFWIGLTVLFFVAAWKIDVPILGDIAALMVLLQALGRLLSFVMDGYTEQAIHYRFLPLESCQQRVRPADASQNIHNVIAARHGDASDFRMEIAGALLRAQPALFASFSTYVPLL